MLMELFELINQARAGSRPARAWFLKTDPVRIVGMRACVCVFVCVSATEGIITSGVILTSYDWLNKFYSCYIATVVVIVFERGLGIGTRRRQ